MAVCDDLICTPCEVYLSSLDLSYSMALDAWSISADVYLLIIEHLRDHHTSLSPSSR